MKRPFMIKELATKNDLKMSKNEFETVITTTNNELEKRIDIIAWKLDQFYRKLSIFKDETDQKLNKIINSLDGLARLISEGRIEYDYVFWKRENEAIRPS
jgi:hypothetical protein